MNWQPRLTTARRAPATTDGDGRSTEDRLGQALDEFYSAVDAGQQPDRARLLEKYADVADELADCLRNLDFIQNVAPQLAGKHDERDKGVASPVNLGDFRIICELGRGGMGVVYEAEQLSIGRRVALKVLPFATLADPRALTRFKNEVRAAATLDHQNIVAVYSVGEERGIHYFAMQLIRGQSFEEVIRNLRQIRDGRKPADNSVEGFTATRSDQSDPALRETRALAAATTSVPSESGEVFYRRVAELGEQAASALHFAHEQGVIHRDIKPANLMLDATGKMYVTDFGLARIESDAGVTMTGDLIGTLRYMAPEQALAKRITVDHRADIYSLGATLYEFATLQPIFAGTNREQLLRQVAFEQPVAPSKIVRDMPRDLETIICKAIGKNPEERYTTSAELAEDLRRWLDYKPILGKRPSSFQIVKRWVQRNPVFSIAALATSLVIIAALAFGIALTAAQAEHQQRAAYSPSLTAAFNEYKDGHLNTVDALLRSTKPDSGQQDLRGFEWHLLDKLRGDIRTDGRLSFNGRVQEVTYSPGGRWLGALTMNGQLVVVDLEHDFRQTVLETAELPNKDTLLLSSFAFSPDDRYLYSSAHHNEKGGETSPLIRYDLTAPKPKGEPFTDTNIQTICYAVAVATDGRIATLGWSKQEGDNETEGTCVVWDPAARAPLASNKIIGSSVCWSSDGERIVIADWEDKKKVSILGGRQLDVRDILDVNVKIARFSPDGRLLAAGSGHGASFWDVTTTPANEIAGSTTDNWVWDLAFLDNDHVAIGYENGQVEVWNARTVTKVEQFCVQLRVATIACSGNELVLGGASKLLWKTFIRSPTGPVEDGWMHTVGIADGSATLVTQAGELKVWSPKNEPQSIANIKHDLPSRIQYQHASDVCCSNVRQAIAVVHRDHQGDESIPYRRVSVWRRSGEFITEFDTNGSYAAFTPRGDRIVTFDSADHTLDLWDWEKGTRVDRSDPIPVQSGAGAIRFSPSGKYVATGHGVINRGHGAVCVWTIDNDVATLVKHFEQLEYVEDVAFDPDEQWVAAGDVSGVVLHHIVSDASRKIDIGGVRGVDISPDGTRLVTADDTKIRFWNFDTGSHLGTLDVGGFLTCVRYLDRHRLLYIVRGVGARILDAPESG